MRKHFVAAAAPSQRLNLEGCTCGCSHCFGFSSGCASGWLASPHSCTCAISMPPPRSRSLRQHGQVSTRPASALPAQPGHRKNTSASRLSLCWHPKVWGIAAAIDPIGDFPLFLRGLEAGLRLSKGGGGADAAGAMRMLCAAAAAGGSQWCSTRGDGGRRQQRRVCGGAGGRGGDRTHLWMHNTRRACVNIGTRPATRPSCHASLGTR